MGSETLKEQIKFIWDSTGQNDCIKHSATFYKNLLQTVEEIYKSEDQESLVSLLESIAEKHRTFPFLLYIRYGNGINKLTVLQNILNNIKTALISFITHKYKKTEMQPSTLNQFLHFTEKIDPASELLFMNVIPQYMKQHKKSLIPADFKEGLLQTLLLTESEFHPYIAVVHKIIDEYEHDFLSLSNYTLYPLKDILFHYAQKSALEENYLLLYSWISSQEREHTHDFLIKTSIPPYLYPLFLKSESSDKGFSHIIQLLAGLSDKACRDGLLSLEDDIAEIENSPVLKNGLQSVVDGTELILVKRLMEDKINTSIYLYKMRLKIITRGLLSIYMGDNPRVTEEIMRSIVMNIHTNEIENLIVQLTNYSRTARMEGILVLEDVLPEISDIFLKQGIKLIVSGAYYDYAHILLNTLAKRLIEEKTLYYSLIKSGIMHIASGTHARATEKHLRNMVPFDGNSDIKIRVSKKREHIIFICKKLCNTENLKTAGEEHFYNLYRLMTTLISLKAGLIGFYIYYISYFTDDKHVPDFMTLNKIFNTNSSIAEDVLNEKAEIPAFILPLSYKNELLARIAALRRIYSNHNTHLDEKISKLSEDLDKILKNTMIILKKYEAEKNPSIENLSFLSEEKKIICFLKGLGELHKKQSKKYNSLFSELAQEFSAGIASLSRNIFSFVPDFSGIEDSPHLSLALILQIITKNDFLLTKIDSIFPEDIATLVRNRLFTFSDIVYISDNGMKDILSHVSINDLVFALKTADSYIQNKFYINLTESRLQELKEHMEFCGPVAVADVKQARDKIVMYAFKLDEMGPYLAFRAMRGKSFINKLM